jgi:hypothetical protein
MRTALAGYDWDSGALGQAMRPLFRQDLIEIPAGASDLVVAGVVLRNQIYGLTRKGRYASDIHSRAILWNEPIKRLGDELDRFDATYADASGSPKQRPLPPEELAAAPRNPLEVDCDPDQT